MSPFSFSSFVSSYRLSDDDGDGSDGSDGSDGNGGGRSRSRACITSCSLGSASSRLGIDRLCPRGPHGDLAFVQTRASPPVLASNMALVGGHVASPPLQRYCTTTDATRTRQCVLDHRKGYMMQPRIRPSLSLCLCPPLSQSPFLIPLLSHSLSLSFCRSLPPSLCLSASLIPTGSVSVSISSCILLFRDGLNICTTR